MDKYRCLSYVKDMHFRRILLLAALLAGCVLAGGGAAQGADEVWQPLIERLCGEKMSCEKVKEYFSDEDLKFDPSIMAGKVDRMVRKQFEPQPAPTKRTLEESNYGYYLKPSVIAGAADFARANKDILAKTEAAYGVPQDIIVALLLVETKLGSYLGKDGAFQVLASMAASNSLSTIQPFLKDVGDDPLRAAFADASAKDRAEWAYQELKALIRYAEKGNRDPMDIPGSIYGAIGLCQFMPSNALRYGVAGDGGQAVDLFAPGDAIPSIANYLVRHGWKPGLDYDRQRAVIYAYNHSDLYSLAVMTVAGKLKEYRLAH